jgi:peptide/nickel transport system ATP-binding protein
MGLLDPNARVSGEILHQGRDLVRERQSGKVGVFQHFAMIFQYPRTALNPIRRVGDQLADVLRVHERSLEPQHATARAVELLEEVKISRARERIRAYPFELSGGMCQRVLIAMALAQKPQVLIADEPTTGLDVVTQKTVMHLLEEAQREYQMGVILITHDLGLASMYCQDLVVLEKGKLVERGTPEALFNAAQQPYTQLLIGATPGLSGSLSELERACGVLHDQ